MFPVFPWSGIVVGLHWLIECTNCKTALNTPPLFILYKCSVEKDAGIVGASAHVVMIAEQDDGVGRMACNISWKHRILDDMDQPPKYIVFLPVVAAMAIPFPLPFTTPRIYNLPRTRLRTRLCWKRDPKVKLNQLVSTLRWSWWLLLLLLLLAQHPLCCLLKQYPHSHPSLVQFFRDSLIPYGVSSMSS